MNKKIWAVAIVAATVGIALNAFDASTMPAVPRWARHADSARTVTDDAIDRDAIADGEIFSSHISTSSVTSGKIAPGAVADVDLANPYYAGRDTLSSDGKGLAGKGYEWVACTGVGDSTDTAVLITFTECGCTVQPNENAIPFADSLVSGAGFMARITYDNADPIGFSWLVVKF